MSLAGSTVFERLRFVDSDANGPGFSEIECSVRYIYQLSSRNQDTVCRNYSRRVELSKMTDEVISALVSVQIPEVVSAQHYRCLRCGNGIDTCLPCRCVFQLVLYL